MQKYLAIFEGIKVERSAELKTLHGLDIKTGEGLGAAILKVLKPTWTTDKPGEILNTNGMFFSVWIDADCEAEGIVRYNLHAKKLRAIKGEKFAAREFARAFRAQSGDDLKDWPNCSYPKGPITLFEGYFKLDAATLQNDTNQIVERFASFSPQLDRLLKEA
jgi:hypothetical protein